MWLKAFLFCLIYSTTFVIYAVDIAKLPVRHNDTKAYQKAIIEEALLQSEDKYGPYIFVSYLADLSSKRSFNELNRDDQEYINMRVGITSKEREEGSIPIRLPLRKGLLSYKLLIINKKNINLFDETKTIDDLKKFNFGVVYDWVTAEIMQENAFKVMDVPSYDGLFRALDAGRFDYTVLGVNEAFPILESLIEKDLNLTVAPGIALYINTPSYIFVSPKRPRLAERIQWGIEKMIKNGRFDEIFYQYHEDALVQVNLKERRIISIDNPKLKELPIQPPFERSELWFDPLE